MTKRKPMTVTVDELAAADAWSGKKFARHIGPATVAICGAGYWIRPGRTAIWIEKDCRVVAKVYVHHAGRSADWLSVVSPEGDELLAIHCDEPGELAPKILKAIDGR